MIGQSLIRDGESRRDFLRTLTGGVFAIAAERVWPFRSYSFPSEEIIFYDGFFVPPGFIHDLEFVRRYMAEDICRVFQIPPYLIGETNFRSVRTVESIIHMHQEIGS